MNNPAIKGDVANLAVLSAAVAQAKANVDHALQDFIAAHASHEIGATIDGKRVASGKACKFRVKRISARLTESGNVLVDYHGAEIKADGTPGSIAAYVWEWFTAEGTRAE